MFAMAVLKNLVTSYIYKKYYEEQSMIKKNILLFLQKLEKVFV